MTNLEKEIEHKSEASKHRSVNARYNYLVQKLNAQNLIELMPQIAALSVKRHAWESEKYRKYNKVYHSGITTTQPIF